MSDLISREALIKAFESHGLEWRYLKKLNPILEEVDKQPFVIEKPKERTAKVETVEKPNVFKCSKCGQYFHRTAWSSPVLYCSRCGARLEWE